MTTEPKTDLLKAAKAALKLLPPDQSFDDDREMLRKAIAADAQWRRRVEAVVEAARFIGTDHSGWCATVKCNCTGTALKKVALAKALAALDELKAGDRERQHRTGCAYGPSSRCSCDFPAGHEKEAR